MKLIFATFCLILLIPKFMEAQSILATPVNELLKLSNGKILLSSPPPPPCGVLTVTDVDGNTYNTVKIGNQCWISRNLATSKFNDGTPLDEFSQDGRDPDGYIPWTIYAGYLKTDPWFIWEDAYGYLYNWRAVDNHPATRLANNGSKNICPFGWHVPNDTEWETLFAFVQPNVGYALREAGLTHWPAPNNATNSSGFTALPGGAYSLGYYGRPGWAGVPQGYFWSTSSINGADLTLSFIIMSWDDMNVWHAFNGRLFQGMSVRCLQN